MIHVVGPKQGAPHLLQQIIIFIGRFCATIDGHRVRTVALVNLDQFIGSDIQGGIPIGFDPVPIIGDLRMFNRLPIRADGKDLFSSFGFWFSFKQISSHQAEL